MNGRFVFRPLAAVDLDRAAQLHRQAFEPLGERPWTYRDMAELLSSPGIGGLLIEGESREDGFALWRTAADEAELLTIAVKSELRRHGLGRGLLAAVVEHVRRAGAQTLFLEVATDNAPARALYAQAGFAEVGRRPGYYRRHNGFADALVLRLTLTAGG